ncbi:MAG TPA: DNA polymerase III subunit delta [Longimicrobiales bacterium]|nr:DNA polymerase III subunit delta [Longimicrobiales bacterium]
MKVWSPDALRRALSTGKRGGKFFLFGDEEYLKEETTAALVEAHLEPSTRDFNLDQLRAGETTPEQLASIIATPPLMAEWRVVIVRDVQAAGTAPRLRATLESLLEHELPGLLLILSAQIPPGRAQFYEKLKKLTTPVECAALSEADLPGWLMTRAGAQGRELDADAARLLVSSVGTDLGTLVQELNKLCEYAGERPRLDRAAITAAVGRVARQNRWEWFDLVSDRKFAEARAGLGILLDSTESGVGLVIGLGTQFLRLAIAASGGQRALEEALPPNQKWLASRLMRQTRGWSLPALEQALEDLLRADRLLKTSSLGDIQVLEEFLLRVQVYAQPAAA